MELCRNVLHSVENGLHADWCTLKAGCCFKGGMIEESAIAVRLRHRRAESLNLPGRVAVERTLPVCSCGLAGRFFSSVGRPCSHSGCGLEFQEKKLGSLNRESRRPVSGSVRVSGADFFLGLSLGTDRKSGASVERGVDGALLGPLRALDGSCVSEMEMAGGNVPILRLVACCVARSYSLTSSMVISDGVHFF